MITTANNLPAVDFEKKLSPVVNIGRLPGSGKGELNSPWGVTVDHKTGNIYVGDMCNHYSQYFDSEGRYVSKMGAGLLDYPRCIAIHDDKVL